MYKQVKLYFYMYMYYYYMVVKIRIYDIFCHQLCVTVFPKLYVVLVLCTGLN